MPTAVSALRERKYRKEKPFAVMVKDLEAARAMVELSPEAEDAAYLGGAADRAGAREGRAAGRRSR